ncbi:MAG: hypothetical protein LBD87_02750 [Prevotellaceae bacterium]|jgi:uncharacterized protein (TIGR02145 family)|nr:hypothetical protein [Prevotellaceae bacterium]
MKRFFFLFAMFTGVTASATVTVTPIKTEYAAQKVTFEVKWTGSAVDNRVWVWIDFCPVSGTSPGTFAKAVISAATTTAGSIIDLNGRGFYVTANPATVTATLSNAAGKFNWCVYGSDAPPKMLSNNNGTLTLGGTPPFVLSDATGSNTYPVPGKTVTVQTVLNAGVVPVYISDETGCKGLLGFGNPVLQGSCTFTQPPVVNTFSAFPANYSAATFVSLVDERDLKIYTAVKIGNRWWMGQNLNYQTGLTYFDQHSKPNGTTGSNPALRGGFWCPADNDNSTPVAVCDYWGALYAWETAMMLDGKGTWTEVSGSYCTGAANSANCKVNHGRKASSGTAIGGRGICPPNWHVPTDFELGVLFDAMESGGGTTHQTTSVNGSFIGKDAGTRGKASCQGNSGDYNPTWDSGAGTDVFNFRGLAGDDRNSDGINNSARGHGNNIWGSSTSDANYAWKRCLDAAYTGGLRMTQYRSNGASVRCVRD